MADARMPALLIAAASQAVAGFEGRKPEAEKTDPSPEEMLAVGLAIGICEASRRKESQPARQSLWKMAARLGL